MKRYVVAYKDPDNNPSDRAEAIIQDLGTIITQIGNIQKRIKRTYLEHGADDTEMTKLADKYGDMLKELVAVYDKYAERK